MKRGGCRAHYGRPDEQELVGAGGREGEEKIGLYGSVANAEAHDINAGGPR